ncbi:MAG: hypothetical protein R3C56_41650 [Pirellulaceae bacterium]
MLWRLTVKKPEEGFMACFVEFVSNTDATPAFFSTNVRIFLRRNEQSRRPFRIELSR